MRNFRYLSQVVSLEIDAEHCIGCGRCEEVCPHAVFQLSDGRARIVDFDACMECGACAQNCPVSVITVDAGVGCASGLLSEWFRERGIGKGMGSC